MFKFKNLFRNQNVDDIIDAIKARGSYTVDYPDIKEPNQEPKEALYKVGMNEDGMTQLTVGNSNSLGVTLTLNTASVAHLIKLLAVNIDQDYFVNVKAKNETV